MIVSFISISVLAQEIPLELFYHGMLMDKNGNPLNESAVNITFSIWDSEQGTDISGQKWQEAQKVNVTDGYFGVLLGSTKPIPADVFQEKERYLEIVVESETLKPRQKIASSPYAYTASAVRGKSNVFNSDGNVGIGTNDPQKKLEVDGWIKTSQGVEFADGSKMTNASLGACDSLRLPFAGRCNSGETGFRVTQAGQSGNAVEGILENCAYTFPNREPIATAAIKGFANGTNEDGVSYGGYFASWSGNGMGVWAGSGGINGIGVYGEANGDGGYGLYGKAFKKDAAAIYGENDEGIGLKVETHNANTAEFYLDNPNTTEHALYASSTGKGAAIEILNLGGGEAASFSAKGGAVLELENTGNGYVIDAETKNYGIDMRFTSVGGMLRAHVREGHTDGFGWFFHTRKGRRQILGYDYGIAMSANDTDFDHLVIREGGHVGIGTVWPQDKLHVNGNMRCDMLTITGGSDIAEPFDISHEIDIKPGMVMSIDADNPGLLKAADQEYDRCVAGIVSGAGGIAPGMIMGQEGSIADGEHAIALSGRVYCLADASNGAIEPGDLLTTSDVPGHAQKATNYKRSQGAIIGKAMTALEEGQGLVLVLVALQ